MAVTAKLFGNALVKAFNKEIDFDSDSIRVALLTDTTAPVQDTWDYFDDAKPTEIAGTGYTAYGAVISSPSVTYNGTTNVVKLDGADVSWTSATFTCRYAVIYDFTPGSDGTRPLIAFIDFGENISVTAGTFQITFAADGIVTITVA